MIHYWTQITAARTAKNEQMTTLTKKSITSARRATAPARECTTELAALTATEGERYDRREESSHYYDLDA